MLPACSRSQLRSRYGEHGKLPQSLAKRAAVATPMRSAAQQVKKSSTAQ
jgi:hypothetical protein